MKAVPLGASAAALVLCSLLACAPALRADDGIELRKALVRATVRAIELEIESYRGKLKTAERGTGPRENVERFRKRLAELEAERAACSRLKPEEYPEPVRQAADSAPILEQSPGFGPVVPPVYREVRVTVGEPCSDGALPSVEGTSKSGPFYHLAGIAGGDYGVLKREADALFGRLADGGKVEMPMEDMFWGDCFGMLTDRFGIQWMASFGRSSPQ